MAIRTDRNQLVCIAPAPTDRRVKCTVSGGKVVSDADLRVADRLPTSLSRPEVLEREAKHRQTEKIHGFHKNPQGQFVGPLGQPLVVMKRANPKEPGLPDLLYVDPNTNQYWMRHIAGGREVAAGVKQEGIKGPFPLPDDARFSESYFNVASVAVLDRGFKEFPRDVFERSRNKRVID